NCWKLGSNLPNLTSDGWFKVLSFSGKVFVAQITVPRSWSLLTKKLMMTSTKMQDIQFVFDTKHSFCEDILKIKPPYTLTLTVEELIFPCPNSRRALQYQKNPETCKPPRPPNAYMIFRKNYNAEIKLTKGNLALKEISRLASQKWDVQNAAVKHYFVKLAKAAKEKHIERYKNYKYVPNKNRIKKPSKITPNNIEAKTGQTLPSDGAFT
ncbi:7470_t:CDS:2, partial [Cetraspora pellucida]